MRKTNIFRNLRPENKVSFLVGWRQLKRHRQIFALLVLTLWLISPILVMVGGDFINVQLINFFSGPILFYSYVTVFSVSPNSRRSIVNQLSVQDDRLSIAGEVLPANVKKLVLGKDPRVRLRVVI